MAALPIVAALLMLLAAGASASREPAIQTRQAAARVVSAAPAAEFPATSAVQKVREAAP
jgi:hypothetical protein